MKDSQGNKLYINDIVTINVGAKPDYLVGRIGKIEGYGDIRLKLLPIDNESLSISQERRIEPSYVIKGKHSIINPSIYALRRSLHAKRAVEAFFAKVLSTGVDKKIITLEQTYELMDLLEEVWSTSHSEQSIQD